MSTHKVLYLFLAGHVLLVHLLLDVMKKSGPARIINTTAAAYQLGEIDVDDLNFERREYVASKAFSQSKLSVCLFTALFPKKFKFEGKD